MRSVILQMQISADGFVAAHGSHDWQLWGWGDRNGWDERLKQDFNTHFQTIDTILLSRAMVEEGYLSHWGKAAKRYPRDPFYAFARRIIEIRKVVMSRGEDLPREVRVLKAEHGSAIAVFGGTNFASSLISAGLVDELQFYVNPAVLGNGARLFAASGFQKLTLLGSKAYDCGIVVSRYAP